MSTTSFPFCANDTGNVIIMIIHLLLLEVSELYDYSETVK